jgi:hypothetical protein
VRSLSPPGAKKAARSSAATAGKDGAQSTKQGAKGGTLTAAKDSLPSSPAKLPRLLSLSHSLSRFPSSSLAMAIGPSPALQRQATPKTDDRRPSPSASLPFVAPPRSYSVQNQRRASATRWPSPFLLARQLEVDARSGWNLLGGRKGVSNLVVQNRADRCLAVGGGRLF